MYFIYIMPLGRKFNIQTYGKIYNILPDK